MLRINFLKMADESRKRARLSLEQKLWIIHHKTENQRITNAKVALDFSVKFNRPTSRQAICYVLKYKDEILRDVNVDPEKNIKKAKYVKKDTMAKFEADLLEADLVEVPDERPEKPKVQKKIHRSPSRRTILKIKLSWPQK